jgi:hypothetical protein
MTYSKSEVGHALNAANLEKLILNCQVLSANYNPSVRPLQIVNLLRLLADSKNAIEQVTNNLNAYKNAVNKRQDAFASLKPLATQIIGALISGGASLQTIKDARAINAKLQGKGKNVRRNKKEKLEDDNSNGETNNSNGETNNPYLDINNSNGETGNPKAETNNSNGETNNSNGDINNSNGDINNSNGDINNPNGEKRRGVSTIQQSYAQIVSHWAQLINFIQQTPSYNPNEIALQVPNLLQVLNTLQTENTNLLQTEIALTNARIMRDEVLYNPQTGVVVTAMLVKEYCKSLLSTRSPLYKEVYKIRFSSKK